MVSTYRNKFKIVFSYSDIMFGYKVAYPSILLNFVIFSAIQFAIPKFERFLQQLHFEYEIEKFDMIWKADYFNNLSKLGSKETQLLVEVLNGPVSFKSACKIGP